MMGLVKVIREAPLENIATPTLVLYSPHDKIVDVGAIRDNVHRFSSLRKEIVAVNNVGDPQYHVLAGDILSPQTTETVADIVIEFVLSII